jgi:hypothetical protein
MVSDVKMNSFLSEISSNNAMKSQGSESTAMNQKDVYVPGGDTRPENPQALIRELRLKEKLDELEKAGHLYDGRELLAGDGKHVLNLDKSAGEFAIEFKNGGFGGSNCELTNYPREFPPVDQGKIRTGDLIRTFYIFDTKSPFLERQSYDLTFTESLIYSNPQPKEKMLTVNIG